MCVSEEKQEEKKGSNKKKTQKQEQHNNEEEEEEEITIGNRTHTQGNWWEKWRGERNRRVRTTV